LDCIHGGIEDVRWYSLVSLTAEEVHLVLVKQARDRKGMIVRLLETGGSTTQGMITVKENKYPFSITAYELKTFLIDESTQSIQIVNYLEEPNEKLS
jgi:hypothetical protein